ncbi:phage tail protein [Sporolactobacillus sp. CQH2019]|uniref:phage tail protein n=1 Tax=Sporolactobacillus sp. CQH2019 TaxID=3023512 RepID=UPI0023688642|nr:phage tail protein [Sporolactobacillus sp. CQH2019]MDD9149336.1 phage tail protein [Sporolactobacillus sp. CQH2019]
MIFKYKGNDEKMAMLVGFESARIGILDDNEQVDPAKIFTINGQQGGTLGANISNLNYTPTINYASNIAYRVSGKGTGAATCTLTTEDIPMDIIYQITGATKNENGIYTIGRDTQAPYCALEMISGDSGVPSKKVYLALLKGVFGFPALNPQTNNAAEVDFTDSLTFTCLNRKSDDLVFAEGFEADSSFQEASWTQFVFPAPTGSTTTTTTVAG